MAASKHNGLITSFNLQPGRVVARKFELVSQLGAGWEGEVYMVRERRTGIERAAKFYYPHRNPNEKVSRLYAKKLHKLRHCGVLIQYHTEETMTFRKQHINCMISEYVEGELLTDYLKRQRGKRLSVFEGIHLLHALASGMEKIHDLSEYHGDLHAENVFVKRVGLGFDVKLIDLFDWKTSKNENIRDDVCDLVKIFYDSIGGKKHYANQPKVAKDICCGLRKSLMLKKFRTGGQLRRYLETLEWD